MITPFSRVANHRCPQCDRLQSRFALRTTMKAGLQRPRLNTSLTCPQCGASLRMVPHPNGPGLFIWQVLGPAVFGALYLLGFHWVASQFSLRDGLLLPALSIFAYSLIVPIVGALLSARLERLFLKVEVL